MADEVGAGRRPIARDDVHHARREADLRGQLRQPQGRERRLRVGLEDNGAAGRQRGRELPGRHHQRVVPGHDLARHADRLLQRVEQQRAADRVRPAADRGDRGTVVAEVLDGLVELRLHRRDRLADVPRLELRELAAVGDDRVRERVEQPRTLGTRSLAPGTVECATRCLDRPVDVRLAGQSRDGKGSAGRRLDELARLAGYGLDGLAPDEEARLALRCRAHDADDTSAERRSCTRTCSVSRRRNRAGSPSWYALQRSRPAE